MKNVVSIEDTRVAGILASTLIEGIERDGDFRGDLAAAVSVANAVGSWSINAFAGDGHHRPRSYPVAVWEKLGPERRRARGTRR